MNRIHPALYNEVKGCLEMAERGRAKGSKVLSTFDQPEKILLCCHRIGLRDVTLEHVNEAIELIRNNNQKRWDST